MRALDEVARGLDHHLGHAGRVRALHAARERVKRASVQPSQQRQAGHGMAIAFQPLEALAAIVEPFGGFRHGFALSLRIVSWASRSLSIVLSSALLLGK